MCFCDYLYIILLLPTHLTDTDIQNIYSSLNELCIVVKKCGVDSMIHYSKHGNMEIVYNYFMILQKYLFCITSTCT
jgi:hypothetical protein